MPRAEPRRPHGGDTGSVARRSGVRHGRVHQSMCVNIDACGKRIVTGDNFFQMASVSSSTPRVSVSLPPAL